MTTLTIHAKRTGPVKGRHPWVFSQAIVSIPEGLAPGEPLRLVAPSGQYLASGYFSSYSQIAVRVWGHEDGEAVDRAFFARRIRRAAGMRRKLVDSAETDCWRVVHGENDLLPGLVVDRYADWLVVQFHTQGMERWRGMIVEALVEEFSPTGIFERSEASARRRDGLGCSTGLLHGTAPDVVEVRENGFKFLVDIRAGQKTGFFLDQRENRRALMRYAPGQDVLNCFSYSGGFTVYALAAGAARVTSVDVSEPALELARANIRLNGLDEAKAEFHCEDVKGYLRAAPEGAHGLIVLDPPAFIKDRRKRAEGVLGYRAVNEQAMRVLADPGVLMTCSCSSHLDARDFRYMLTEAAGRVGRGMRVIEARGAGIDHPSLLPYTEGDYLKCLVLEG
jgi:23S rRNA (cytosine1962-C5)-methyltransferase